MGGYLKANESFKITNFDLSIFERLFEIKLGNLKTLAVKIKSQCF